VRLSLGRVVGSRTGDEVVVFEGVGVAAGGVDAEAEQVGDGPDVAPGGVGCPEDAVLAQLARTMTPRERYRDERGVAAVWTLLSASGVFLLLLGLVYDGGSVIDARLEAKRAAEQAARAGADELRGARSGNESVDAEAAAARARDILRRAGWSGTVRISGAEVRVTVIGSEPTTFLSAVGIKSFRVDETGAATAITGPR
jgi:hypothetical protein